MRFIGAQGKGVEATSSKGLKMLKEWLAGSRAGVYPDKAGFAKTWALEQRFEPQMPVDTRDTLYAGWKDAVRRALG